MNLFGFPTLDTYMPCVPNPTFEDQENKFIPWTPARKMLENASGWSASSKVLYELPLKEALKTIFMIQAISKTIPEELYAQFLDVFEAGFEERIPAKQESLLVNLILGASQNQKVMLFKVCSKFNLKCGDETFTQACNLLPALPFSQRLSLWESLQKMPASARYNEPKSVETARKEAFAAEFKCDPVAAYEGMKTKDPKLLINVVRALYEMKNYEQAATYALKYASESSDPKAKILKRVALKCPIPELLEHPLLKDEEDLLMLRVASSKNPAKYLDALMDCPEGGERALQIIQSGNYTQYTASIDKILEFVIDIEEIDLVPKVLNKLPNWIPSVALLSKFKDIAVELNSERLANRIYQHLTIAECTDLAAHFLELQVNPKRWIPRASSCELEVDEHLIEFTASNAEEALEFYNSLCGVETKKQWANLVYVRSPLDALLMIQAGADVEFNEEILTLAKETERAQVAWEVYYKKYGFKDEYLHLYVFFSDYMTDDVHEILINRSFQVIDNMPAFVRAANSAIRANDIYRILTDVLIKIKWAIAIYKKDPLLTYYFFKEALVGYQYSIDQLATDIRSSTRSNEEKCLAWHLYAMGSELDAKHISTYKLCARFMRYEDAQKIIDTINFETLPTELYEDLTIFFISIPKDYAIQISGYESIFTKDAKATDVHSLLTSIFVIHFNQRTMAGVRKANKIFDALKQRLKTKDESDSLGFVEEMKQKFDSLSRTLVTELSDL